MSTGDKICKHGLWLANCKACDPSYERYVMPPIVTITTNVGTFPWVTFEEHRQRKYQRLMRELHP